MAGQTSDCFDSLEEFEKLLTRISGGENKVDALEGRQAVAAALGYADSRMLVFFLETHGLPLSLSAVQCQKHGLNIDFAGLRYELERIGKKPATIDSELKEVQHFVDNAA